MKRGTWVGKGTSSDQTPTSTLTFTLHPKGWRVGSSWASGVWYCQAAQNEACQAIFAEVNRCERALGDTGLSVLPSYMKECSGPAYMKNAPTKHQNAPPGMANLGKDPRPSHRSTG